MTAEISFTKVRLPYGWLGNMAPYPVIHQDIRWPTTEHLFQALRFMSDDPVRELIRAALSPMAAKFKAKEFIGKMIIAPRGQADVENMRMVIKLKHDSYPDLRKWLQETGDATIIEDCSARANVSGLFWGAAMDYDSASWKGENVLGKLWMERREAYRVLMGKEII